MTEPNTEGRARPLGAYPHARRAGDFIFLSGTSARLPDGSIAGAKTARDGTRHYNAALQTRVVLEALARTLGEFGAGLTDCVEIVVFLVDMADFAAYNAVYGEIINHGGPARTTVAVRALPHPDMRVEMKAVAYKPV